MGERVCHLGPAQGNPPACKRKTPNQRRWYRQGNEWNHGERDLWEYEQEIMGLWEVAAQVKRDAVQMKDYVSDRIDMVPYFAPPP